MSYINRPLDVIGFSERTRNALIKNDIQTTNDLRSIKNKIDDIFFVKVKLKWVWRKWIKEIVNWIKVIEEDFNINYSDVILENKQKEEEIIEEKKHITKDYSNPHFYIPIKRNNSNWSYNQRQERKKTINDYLFSIYEWNQQFDLTKFIRIFIETLSEIEINILKNRLLFIENNYVLPLSEIAKTWNITHERVRQIEDSLLKKIKNIFTDFSYTEIWLNFKEHMLETKNIKDYNILDFSNNKNEYINWNFLSEIYKNIFSKEYNCIYLNKKKNIWDVILIYKKDSIDAKVINKFLTRIDKIYKEKRPEDKKVIKDIFIWKIAKESLKIYLSNPWYEYCILKYLWHIYNIFQTNGIFILPQNKKDLKFLVKKELESLNEPIHFKKMHEIVVEKYPEYKRNYWKVHNALMQCGKNVWNWLYVKSEHNMKWWTIWDLAEEYLKNQWWPIEYSELLKHILENKIAKKWSIESVLFDQDKQERFVRIDGKKIWLKKRKPNNVVSSRKTYKIDEEVYDFLKENNIKEFTANEIKEKIGKNLSYQRTIFALNKLVEKWKISFITRWITNYYYVL